MNIHVVRICAGIQDCDITIVLLCIYVSWQLFVEVNIYVRVNRV